MGSNNRPMVVVEVFKKFTYPKSMLNRYDFVADAMNKARNDMHTMVNEIVNNDHHEIHVDMFEFRATEERGYRFRKPELDGNDPEAGDTVNIARAAKILATQKIEHKHGQLNPELSPHLYDREPEMRDAAGQLLREEVWFMRQDIENEMYDYYQRYLDRLRAAQKK